MCWITYQKWRTRPRIAKKKIEVWKVYIKRSCINQDELLVSPYQRETIYLSMRNRLLSIGHNLEIIDGLLSYITDKNWEIWKGYHSYKKGCLQLIPGIGVNIIRHRNFHLERYKSLNKFGKNFVVVKCYIPIGAEYYINEFDQYVSNKIIIGDMIPDADLL